MKAVSSLMGQEAKTFVQELESCEYGARAQRQTSIGVSEQRSAVAGVVSYDVIPAEWYH